MRLVILKKKLHRTLVQLNYVKLWVGLLRKLSFDFHRTLVNDVALAFLPYIFNWNIMNGSFYRIMLKIETPISFLFASQKSQFAKLNGHFEPKFREKFRFKKLCS